MPPWAVDVIDDRDVVRTILDADPRYGLPLDAAGIVASAGLPEDLRN